MEELLHLSEGEAAVRECGAIEYFNGFFDWFPQEEDGPYPNSAITPEEHAAISTVLQLMREASDATPRKVTEDELVTSSWPNRIAPIAGEALALFQKRGRFSEDREEETPSSPVAWP